MKKILLIEDEEMLVEMYKEQFKKSGFETVTAQNSDEVQKKLDSSVDLILLDILLPGENGFDILKKIKSKKEYQKLPVIILTNLGSKETNKDLKLALSLGAKDFLVKAYHTPQQVVQKIEESL